MAPTSVGARTGSEATASRWTKEEIDAARVRADAAKGWFLGERPPREVYWLAMALLSELDAVKGAPWLTGALGVSNAMARLQTALAADKERHEKTSEPNGLNAAFHLANGDGK